MSTTVDPEGTPDLVQADTPPDTPVETQWLPLKEAAPLAGVSIKTMRRRVTAGKIAAEMQSGRWMVRRDALPDSAPAPEQAPPVQTSVPEGAMLVPLSAWEAMMEQLGHLHEAGQELAEARERAGRAEEREAFQLERRQIEQERREALERENAELRAQIAGEPPPAEEPEVKEPEEGLPDIDDAIVEEIGRAVEELRPEHRRPWWQRIWFRR